ncbi:DUF1761 domain-containing protein [Erythrobacter sp. R86502]|uniref:DUF1761 domain-containing protein n=1 Tax=Erythrobacter sp. R86502 TaxID=3093846 RepID=UPI0036D2100D
MNDFALWPVVAGTAAFFVVSLLWYGVVFPASRVPARRAASWQAESKRGPLGLGLALVLTIAFEMLIAMVLWHLLARTDPPAFVVMMMAIGFAIGVMIPAVGINYLQQKQPLSRFLIDAGHLIAGMALMGAVFVWLRT